MIAVRYSFHAESRLSCNADKATIFQMEAFATPGHGVSREA
jgi:hypothetical protein